MTPTISAGVYPGPVPAKWSTILHAAQSAAIVGGAIALAVLGKIDWTVAAAIIASLGGVWGGVGGALAAQTKSTAATVSKVDQGAAAAAPTPLPIAPPGYPPGRAPADAAPGS